MNENPLLCFPDNRVILVKYRAALNAADDNVKLNNQARKTQTLGLTSIAQPITTRRASVRPEQKMPTARVLTLQSNGQVAE